MTFSRTTLYYERSESRTLHGGHVVDVDAKLYSLGDQEPYFSITGARYRSAKRTDAGCEWAGAAHEEIARLFPHLQPIIDVHLSTANGRPMHAIANACYWAGVSGYAPTGDHHETEVDDIDGRVWAPAVLARHLRVPVDEARHIRREIAVFRLSTWNPVKGTKRNYDPAMAEIIAEHDLPARWQADADRALALMTEVRPLVNAPSTEA